MFPHEYSGTVLKDLLADYTPFIMLVAIIFGGLIALMTAFGINPPAIADVIPDIIPAANNSKTNNAGIMGNMGNMFKANNTKNNNGGIMGNMFKANNAKNNNGGIMGNMFKANNAKKNVTSTSFMTV